MPESAPEESQPFVEPTAAALGLNRGRRVLVGCVLAGLLAWAGYAISLPVKQSPAPAAVEAAVPAAVEPEVVELSAPPRRRSKSARSVARASNRTAPAPVQEREARISAPPMLAAVVELAPEVAAAPEPVIEAPAPVAEAEPASELADDGNGEAIARAIAADKRAAIQTCFERELKQTPALTGTLIVELDLAPPHHVNGIRVSDDLDRPEFTQCVSSTMEHLTFVALNEEVSIRVPYVLSARGK